MQTTTPQLMPELRAPLECYQQVRTTFETARDEADRLNAELQRQRKAAESAENEAKQAREEVGQLLREPGTSAKAIQQLKAKERAAYTLAEDYRSVSGELEAAYKEAAEKAGIAKGEERRCHAELLRSYADVLMAQASNVLEPLYRAIRMQERVYAAQAGRAMADWEYSSDDARSAALAVMYGHIKRGLVTFKFEVDGDAVLQAAQRPGGLDRFRELSPAAQQRNLALQQRAAKQL